MLHLNYDSTQNNGIIFNNKYPNGALFEGVKPNLSFEFNDFNYSEVFVDQKNDYTLNGEIFDFTQEQITEIQNIASNWVQPLGQEGNPTLEQAINIQKHILLEEFNNNVKTITSAPSHEMSSWRKQEEQARAYILDNNIKTPMITSLIESRNLGESILDLVNLIIKHADAYEIEYGKILGKYQKLIKEIEVCENVESVQSIVW